MDNFIKYLKINNFKSIFNLELENCRRINLFIGYPNVGKSNALEALSLFSIPFLNEGDLLNKLLRIENKNELFYFSSQKFGVIEIDQRSLNFSNEDRLIMIIESDRDFHGFAFSDDLKSKLDNSVFKPSLKTIKRYSFLANNQWKSNGNAQLLPPFGENIIDTLSYNENVSDVKAWMKQELAKFGLEYVLDKASNSLKIQKRLCSDEVMQLPYSSIADTLQRVIFYKTAIASNKNSILLFEEPEAHAFPPYIQTIMRDIIDGESNQFFIVTHSPLVVNAFLEYEKTRKETSIYLFDFKDNQTTAKLLSDEEMEIAYEYGDDLFFNLENLL